MRLRWCSLLFILQGTRKICSNHRSIPCFYILTKRMMWKILETHATSRVCNLSHIYLINETYNVVHMKGRKCVEWWCKIIKLFNTVNSFVIMIVLYSLYSASILLNVSRSNMYISIHFNYTFSMAFNFMIIWKITL